VLAGSASTFDQLASHYHARLRLPESVQAAVAWAIVEQANAGADDLVVKKGTGTDEIGLPPERLPVR
jgi:hypothetical protein